jgi:hypothetical protein
METIESVIAPSVYIRKQEVKTLYETLITPHLAHSGQPDPGFNEWYREIDTWDRRVVSAFTIKKYLVAINYTDWIELKRVITGLDMMNVTESIRLSQFINDELEASCKTSDALILATHHIPHIFMN